MPINDRTVHLIDDRRMGGVMRFLDQVSTMRPDDTTAFVKRGTMRGHHHDAGTIVSHLAISWRTLPMMITLRACNPNARLVHIEHSYCAGFEQHRVADYKHKRFHTLLRTVYALYDEVVAVSEGQAHWMRGSGVIPHRKVKIATPLVDLAPFLNIPPPEPTAGLRYGFVGRLDEQKGLDAILKPWRDSAPADASFEIFGNGPMREQLEAIAGGDPRITFHGVTNTPAEAYRSFDIALMPSRWEPFGLSCLEAQAAGRPVFVANVDGLPEQVAEGGGRALTGGPEEWAALVAEPMPQAEIEASSFRARQIATRNALNARARWADILDPEGTVSRGTAIQPAE
jgi:glycosyltransferase involved in cell wall biosynthesis